MVKTNSKKFAAIALSLCLATGAVATVGYAGKKGLSASAMTANYAVANANVGYGEANKASDVMVAVDAPATLTVANVPAGQYYLNVIVNEWEGDYVPGLLVQINDGAEEFMNYNFYTGAYTAVIKVTAETKTITLSTYDDTCVVEAYFSDLYIGETNGYAVNADLVAGAPVTLALEGVEAGEYTISLDLGYAPIAEDVTYTAKLNDGEEVVLTRTDRYTVSYSGVVTTTADSTSITLSTTNEMELTAFISLEKVIHIDPLPEMAKFNLYEPVTYSYTATATGYYSLNYTNVDQSEAEWGITFKKDSDGLDSTTVQGNNFPLYLVEGDIYYFEIAYQGIPVDYDEDFNPSRPIPQTATVKLSIEKWIVPTLKAYSEFVWAPVTTEESDIQVINLDARPDTYFVGLADVPFGLYMLGSTVTVHWGDNSVELNIDNGFGAEITITNEKTMWFTTDFVADFVAGVALGGTAGTMELNKAEEITLSGTNQTALYTIELPAGRYSLAIAMLDGDDAEILVSVNGELLLSNGDTIGYFNVVVEENDEGITTSAVQIIFEYNGTEEVTFMAIVKAA